MKQDLSSIDSIVLDIEGTICPISFVKETLFPYAIKALPEVLQQKWDDPEFVKYRDAFPEDARSSPEAFEAHVQDLTKRDVKVAYLKNLQGYLWCTGYTTNTITTPLYPDVLPTLHTWKSHSKPLSIYSSGSIPAQHLLMSHVTPPASFATLGDSIVDARNLISHWYDTTNAGPKTASASYRVIAGEMGREGEEGKVLFLSDSVAEVDSAIEAGMKGVVVVREGNAPLSEGEREGHDVIGGLGEVSEAMGIRR